MYIIGLTGIVRTTCIETTGKMPVANHAPNLCPHHQRQDRTGYGGIERETRQRLQDCAVSRCDSGYYTIISFRRQGIKRRRWKYARPCESPEGRALRISIFGVLLVATVGKDDILRLLTIRFRCSAAIGLPVRRPPPVLLSAVEIPPLFQNGLLLFFFSWR